MLRSEANDLEKEKSMLIQNEYVDQSGALSCYDPRNDNQSLRIWSTLSE